MALASLAASIYICHALVRVKVIDGDKVSVPKNLPQRELSLWCSEGQSAKRKQRRRQAAVRESISLTFRSRFRCTFAMVNCYLYTSNGPRRQAKPQGDSLIRSRCAPNPAACSLLYCCTSTLGPCRARQHLASLLALVSGGGRGAQVLTVSPGPLARIACHQG